MGIHLERLAWEARRLTLIREKGGCLKERALANRERIRTATTHQAEPTGSWWLRVPVGFCPRLRVAGTGVVVRGRTVKFSSGHGEH
jgi:hypothetical protein